MPLVYSIDCNTASRLLLSCSPEIRFLNTCPSAKEMEHVKADAQMLECYAVADYYEAASLYYAYENIGNAAKAAIAKADMEEAEGRMGDLSYCAEEIDGYFVKYFASADSQSQSTEAE